MFSPQPQQQQSSSSADQQPFIQCPSAMKCVPKINCDFNGVMVNYEVRLNRVQEEGRVPLIVSIVILKQFIHMKGDPEKM